MNQPSTTPRTQAATRIHRGLSTSTDFSFVRPEDMATIELESQKLRAALEGIVSIGKRDLTNSKYDGYFEAAREALRETNS